jgi:hypothetical protein
MVALYQCKKHGQHTGQECRECLIEAGRKALKKRPKVFEWGKTFKSFFYINGHKDVWAWHVSCVACTCTYRGIALESRTNLLKRLREAGWDKTKSGHWHCGCHGERCPEEKQWKAEI